MKSWFGWLFSWSSAPTKAFLDALLEVGRAEAEAEIAQELPDPKEQAVARAAVDMVLSKIRSKVSE